MLTQSLTLVVRRRVPQIGYGERSQARQMRRADLAQQWGRASRCVPGRRSSDES